MIARLFHCGVFIFEINKHFMGKYFEIIYTFHSLSDFDLLVKVSITLCFLVTKDDFPFLLLFLLYLLFGTPSQAKLCLLIHLFIHSFQSGWTHGFSFYSLGFNPLLWLFLFDIQIISDLVNGSHFNRAPVSFWHALPVCSKFTLFTSLLQHWNQIFVSQEPWFLSMLNCVWKPRSRN